MSSSHFLIAASKRNLFVHLLHSFNQRRLDGLIKARIPIGLQFGIDFCGDFSANRLFDLLFQRADYRQGDGNRDSFNDLLQGFIEERNTELQEVDLRCFYPKYLAPIGPGKFLFLKPVVEIGFKM